MCRQFYLGTLKQESYRMVIYFRKTGSGRMEWLQVAEVQGAVAGLVNTIMNPWVP